VITMVERIRTLLETRQLTPTQFADAIGVARPIVSHILSGRNKPSLEVVQRILAAMPDLSMPWLLNGTGPMQAIPAAEDIRASAATLKEVPTPAPVPIAPPVSASDSGPSARLPRVPAPYTPPVTRGIKEAKAVPRRFTPLAGRAKAVPSNEIVPPLPVAAPETREPAMLPLATPAAPEELPAAHEPIIPGTAMPMGDAAANTKPAAEFTAAALFAGTEKPIRRIVIFYRDGSFADYQPE
jgi:transcriptional regulator with XRE-family HTH domain